VRLLLLLIHGLSGMLLLGAITHQAIALWWPGPPSESGWWRSLRAVHARRYVVAIMVLFAFSAGVGALIYVPFRTLVRFDFMDAHAPWATGLFEIKEHAGGIGLALLPAYWAVWRDPAQRAGRRSITTLLLLITWWSYLIGHIVNNVRGL
jgi:hypothetical protein